MFVETCFIVTTICFSIFQTLLFRMMRPVRDLQRIENTHLGEIGKRFIIWVVKRRKGELGVGDW